MSEHQTDSNSIYTEMYFLIFRYTYLKLEESA